MDSVNLPLQSTGSIEVQVDQVGSLINATSLGIAQDVGAEGRALLKVPVHVLPLDIHQPLLPLGSSARNHTQWRDVIW